MHLELNVFTERKQMMSDCPNKTLCRCDLGKDTYT